MTVTSFTHSSHGTVPSEMLESWNMVSKAWWISANEGRSNGLHCQPGSEKDPLNLISFTIKYYYKPALTWNCLHQLKDGWATWSRTHMLSWVHRLWVDIPRVAPYGNLSPGGRTPETGQCRGMETCHRWQFPTTVHRRLKYQIFKNE